MIFEKIFMTHEASNDNLHVSTRQLEQDECKYRLLLEDC